MLNPFITSSPMIDRPSTSDWLISLAPVSLRVTPIKWIVVKRKHHILSNELFTITFPSICANNVLDADLLLDTLDV